MRELRLAGCWLLIGAMGLSLAGNAEPPKIDRTLVQLAEKYSKQFLEGKHVENLEMLTEQMRRLSAPEPSEELRASLVAQHGAWTDVGEARFQDQAQAYFRYRVPIHFEHQSIDFMVVFDEETRIAGFFLMPYSGPPRPGEPSPGKEVEVRIGQGDDALPGTLALPKGKGPYPAVILIHGSGALDRDETIGPNKPFRDLAWGLAELGVASLRYDKRSYARPESLRSLAGEMTAREIVIDDVRLALALLRERDEIDGTRVFLVGHSLGGMLLPRIASADPKPAGMISLAGSTLPLPETILAQSRYIVSLDGEVSAPERAQLAVIEKDVRTLRAALDGNGPAPTEKLLGYPFRFYEDLEAHDPPAEAAELKLPILVLQGERDYQVTLEDFQLWRDALAGKPFACLQTYDDLDHLFRSGSGPSTPEDYFARQAPIDPRVIRDIADWITKGTCPRSKAAQP